MKLTEAKELLKGYIHKNGCLYIPKGINFLFWGKDDEAATINGDFTVRELEAIILWMKHVKEEK